ncbi:NUDIX hydrolase [Thermophagus sp. OGC60D27]|uniref:NUDIX hydrolase n=1 Tax=Thermophagus sp. OGC60D27 TaxID=3458415 RepID=UPI0040384A40
MIDINKLIKLFKGPLPGKEAQELMAPTSRQVEMQTLSDSNTKASSVLLLLYPKHDTWHLPFIQRPVYNGFHSGQISFPGGKEESGDKNHLQTALRETHEEIGIEPELVNIIGSLTPIYIPHSNYKVYPFVGWVNSTPHFSPDPVEVDEIIEVSLDELMKNSSIKTFSYQRAGSLFMAPYYSAGDKKIWGATAMILSEMLEMIKTL